MRKESINSFDGGLNLDLNPLVTPSNILTDAVNASFVTYNGDELSLQNDSGNSKIGVGTKNENGTYNKYVSLSSGFYPLGMKEYGGVLYIISGKLPDTTVDEILTFSNSTNYAVGDIVKNLSGKLFYEKKVAGTSLSLPIEGSNNEWFLIGDERDYNNTYGEIEIGSYPSPEASDKKLFDGITIKYDNTGSFVHYRWYPTGVVSCVLDETGRKTGNQLVEKKYQSSTDDINWSDVVGTPNKNFTELNTTACSPPFNFIGISVNSTAYNIAEEVSINYAENTQILVNTPIKAGYNYIFLSIPQNKTLTIKDSLNNNITNKFIEDGIDDRVIHNINKIYKKTDMFATDLSTVLYITIS